MSDEAIYLLDLFDMQIGSLMNEMYEGNVRREKFDRFSYSVWAIQQTIKAINDYDDYVSVSVIRELLKVQQSYYEKWWCSNKEKNGRYKYALWTVEYLLKLTGGYLDE